MSELSQKYEKAKAAAERHRKYGERVNKLIKRRDDALYAFLERALFVWRAEKKAKSSKTVQSVLKELSPHLNSKNISKYSRILKAVRKYKSAGYKSICQYIHANGGINGVLKKRAALRKRTRRRRM